MKSDLFIYPHRASEKRLLGMNRRNAGYVLQFNPRSKYRIVDEKLITKQLAERASVPTPRTYAVVSSYGEITSIFSAVINKHDHIVIKPNRGASGRGVLVLERNNGEWMCADGESITFQDIHYHVGSILSGLYSLNELPDAAIVEQRIFPHDFFTNLTWNGTPDLRVILYRTIPVMAMLRLPTRRSGGRANLHQGAVGVGIDIATGKTRSAVFNNRCIERHPDTGAQLANLEVPLWQTARAISETLAMNLPLLYVGVDLMLDKDHGPMILEANARPGLAIQIANSSGLRSRLEFLTSRLDSGASREETRDELFHLISTGRL